MKNCAQCGKEIADGQHFCDAQCRDKYYPPGTRKKKLGGSALDLNYIKQRSAEIIQEMRDNARTVHIKNGNSGYDVTFDCKGGMKCTECGTEIFVATTEVKKAAVQISVELDGSYALHFLVCADKLLARMKKAEGLMADEANKNHPQIEVWATAYQNMVTKWERLTGQQYIHPSVF